jgi:hypothetical protein
VGRKGTMELRRRAPRVATPDWWGTYTDTDDVRYCKAIDISVLGVGLELFGEVANDLIGHRLNIEIQAPVGESIVLGLRGTVKNVSLGSDGTTRAGLEFVDLSETERAILNAMALMGIGW